MTGKLQGISVDMLANVHCHLREGEVIEPLVKLALRGGADVLGPMPNTKDGLKTAKEVMTYCGVAVAEHMGQGQILPIAMLNEATTEKMISEWVDYDIADCKIYPLNRTTKSHNGVRAYSRLLPKVAQCGKKNVKVHVHPEHPWMLFENRDAEFAFLPIVDMLLNETEAVIVWEHGTDARCIPFWKEMAKSGRFYVTLTAHHLATNESVSYGDVRAVCKPPIKTLIDQMSLVNLVGEGHGWVMAGLDDAPHDASLKHVHGGECACGAYTAPFGLQLYAHALEHMLNNSDGFRRFIDFTSRNARKLHGLKPSSVMARLIPKSFQIPLLYEAGPWKIEPFWAGKTINWTLI